ncbi:MAG TPA: histidine phosphatase family protein [Acidimicrobiia bacterium]|nr:histidine phosphatase family protein [Acidimicrobiia bacterium]
MSDGGGPGELWLVRHGDTEWTETGQHTSRTDVALTARGREQATSVGGVLAGRPFSVVLSSPMTRSIDTCRLAGYGNNLEIDDDLKEWDYGEYEGRTTAEIRQDRPGWTVWVGSPGGEPLEHAAERARRVIERASSAGGDAALFSHGHFLRILGATWLGLPPEGGRLLSLGTAALSILGYEREARVIRGWNRSCETG